MSTIEIISFQQKSESKPSNFAGDDLEDVLVEIVEKPELFLFYLLLKNNTSDTHYYYYYYFFYTSITHYLKKKITVTRHYIFSVPGNQPAKICPKVN